MYLTTFSTQIASCTHDPMYEIKKRRVVDKNQCKTHNGTNENNEVKQIYLWIKVAIVSFSSK